MKAKFLSHALFADIQSFVIEEGLDNEALLTGTIDGTNGKRI
jgi:hypothetical protein